MSSGDARERWHRAIELGVRLGLVAAERAEAARRELAAADGAALTSARVAALLGCGEEIVADLLRLAEASDTPTLRLVGEGTERIASAARLGSTSSSGSSATAGWGSSSARGMRSSAPRGR